jgi:hypothetical protein
MRKAVVNCAWGRKFQQSLTTEAADLAPVARERGVSDRKRHLQRPKGVNMCDTFKEEPVV